MLSLDQIKYKIYHMSSDKYKTKKNRWKTSATKDTF